MKRVPGVDPAPPEVQVTAMHHPVKQKNMNPIKYFNFNITELSLIENTKKKIGIKNKSKLTEMIMTLFKFSFKSTTLQRIVNSLNISKLYLINY